MKINSSTVVLGDKVILVPYLAHHVEKYHKWMASKELQELTASEPLSLEEEYSMQKSWQEDDDKCTFIVLDKAKYDCTANEVDSMIGDTNLYLGDDKNSGEIEVMIAEKDAQRGGRGRETTLMMLRYCTENLAVTKFVAKIGYTNEPSLKLFKSLHFKEVSRSEVFQEITFELGVSDEWKSWLREATPSYVVSSYKYNSKYSSKEKKNC